MRWDGGELTYAGLSELADRLAAELQRRGAGPESVVATCLPRGADLVTAELAILRAGAAYLPLDPENPADRLAYMCADAGVRLVVTSARWADRVPPGLPILELEALDEGLAGPSAVTLDSRNLAYVIYTSGSTGRPKGVMVEHSSLANVVAWRRDRCGLGPSDKTAMIASPGFDASVTDVWPPLTAGACIWVPDQETRLTPARLAAWLLERGVTVTEVPTPLARASARPSVAVPLLPAAVDHRRRPPALPPAAGDPLPAPQRVRPHREHSHLDRRRGRARWVTRRACRRSARPLPAPSPTSWTLGCSRGLSAPGANCCWVEQASPGGIWAART